MLFKNADADDAVAIVPSDTVGVPGGFRSIYVGGAGNITLVTLAGSVVLFSNVPAGFVLRVSGQRVNLTGTTATLMTALI
jgi:hypothetical protein